MRAQVRGCLCLLILVIFLGSSIVGSQTTVAEEQNVGILRIMSLRHPRQVAPSALFQFVIVVEYAVRFNATIRTALFEGEAEKFRGEIWRSEPVTVSGGGDRLWTLNLTAPAKEQSWPLTAIAYHFEDGEWKYFADSNQGPGLSQTMVKVATLATLQIELGVPNIPVEVNGMTEKTSVSGAVVLRLGVGVDHVISVPAVLPFDNLTRLAFRGWQDNVSSPKRNYYLDGDSRIVGFYKIQYLVSVESPISAHSSSNWYDAGSLVVLRVNSSVPMTGLLGVLGLQYGFKGWSGAIESRSTEIEVTVNGPGVFRANFEANYATLIIPMILAIGITGGIILALLGRRTRILVEEAEVKPSVKAAVAVCESCGEPVEQDWSHCVHCGKPLGTTESVND